MATEKPRVAVTMEQEEYEMLSAFAARQGMSRGAVLRDLWLMASPVMVRVLKLLEEAERAKDSVRDGIRQAAIDAEAQMMPMAREALSNFDLFEEAIRESMREAGGAVEAASDTGALCATGAGGADGRAKPPSM